MAAKTLGDAAQAHQEGTTTCEEFEREVKGASGLRDRLTVKLGIQPPAKAARPDCEVGRQVLRRMDQLQSRRTPYCDGGPYAREILRLYPGLRCPCAHEYLERCEGDPQASRFGLARELSGLLQDLQIIIGFAGEQAWDLGTDAEVLAQMQRAASHRAWEGVVRYQREDNEVWTSGVPRFRSVKNAWRTMTYASRVTEVLEEDGDPKFNWQCWKLRLEGKLSASWNNSTVTTIGTTPWRSTDTEELHGYFNEAAPGWLDLRFEQGQPDSATASVGLEDVDLQDTDSAHHGSRGRVLGPQSGALPKIAAPENQTLRHCVALFRFWQVERCPGNPVEPWRAESPRRENHTRPASSRLRWLPRAPPAHDPPALARPTAVVREGIASAVVLTEGAELTPLQRIGL